MPKSCKPRPCKICKEVYQPRNSLQKVCGLECAKVIAKQKSEAKQKQRIKQLHRQHKQKKKELMDNDKSHQTKKAQQLFNRYIRLRDHASGCISCGRKHDGQYHAGHYRTTGANPELRFHPDNCHKQCAPCNNHLSGNLVNYRINLVAKLGLSCVEWLEGPHKPKRYTAEDLRRIQKIYKWKIKKLERANV